MEWEHMIPPTNQKEKSWFELIKRWQPIKAELTQMQSNGKTNRRLSLLDTDTSIDASF